MESKYHFIGKARIEKLLLENDWSIHIRDGEDFFPFLTGLGEREYYPDLMAWKDEIGWVVFEVDGRKGHSSKSDLAKMKMRDAAFLEHDIRTVRISTFDLVGVKKQTDEQNLKEINWQIENVPFTSR